jgi:hypothetical protein
MTYPTAEQMWAQAKSGRISRTHARFEANRIQAAILNKALRHLLLVDDPRQR